MNVPFVVERHDEEDGSITYEVVDTRQSSYRRLCRLNEWSDGGTEDSEGHELSTAKADSELIVRALNFLTAAPLNQAWSKINSLGGYARPGNEFGHGINHAVAAAVKIIEDMGGRDPLE